MSFYFELKTVQEPPPFVATTNVSEALAQEPAAGTGTQPCGLIFAIVVVMLLCASIIVRLHAVDLRHNGGLRRFERPVVERSLTAVMGVLLLTVVVLFAVLLVWAREGRC